MDGNPSEWIRFQRGNSTYYILERDHIWRALLHRSEIGGVYTGRVFLGDGWSEGTSPSTPWPPGCEDFLAVGTRETWYDPLRCVLEQLNLGVRYLQLPVKDRAFPPPPFGNLERAVSSGLPKEIERIRSALPRNLAESEVKDLRGRWHRNRQPTRKTWEQRYPEDAGVLTKILMAEVNCVGDACTDSLRVALVTDKAGMRAFHKARSCCGSHEWSVPLGKRTYLLGFNYGH